jgi:hypothetical protein|tara:strand:+ start:274 stop:525 length:252 start_codon:yes stop_codon:yes gene_type:complete
MRASACSAKYAHVGCGIKHRTCSLRQFLHGCPGVIGISNDPMSVKVLAGVQRSARRDKRELTADQAAAAGFGRSLTLTLTLTL